MTNKLRRIGLLGAARITPWSMIRPARAVPGIIVHAVAARDPARARHFARRYKIPHVYNSYDELIAAPDLDAIYNPLPNGLHGEWSVRALRAGKHVLCEKPMAANAAEAARMAQLADETGLVLMEAFHNLYHPLADNMKEAVQSGRLGKLQRMSMTMATPMLRRNDIRFDYNMAGGATMDLGCYCVRLFRFLAKGEPNVVDARAICNPPWIDKRMEATLEFPGGVRAEMRCELAARSIPQLSLRVQGDAGEMHVINPVLPHLFNWLTVRAKGQTTFRPVWGRSTYYYQLQDFCAAIISGRAVASSAHDATANMRVIDAIYQKANLPLRQPSAIAHPS